MVRPARRLEVVLVAIILVMAMIEGLACMGGVLQIGEALVMTPLIPILATFALLIDYEITYRDAVWRNRWVNDDFKKNTLMVFGIVIVGAGFLLLVSFVGGDLNRVIIDTGGGTSVMCTGLYVVKRFAW